MLFQTRTIKKENKDNFGYLVPTKMRSHIHITLLVCSFLFINEIGVYFLCHLDNTLDTPFSRCEKS